MYTRPAPARARRPAREREWKPYKPWLGVPASYAAELEFDLGADHFEVPVGDEPFYAAVFLPSGRTIGEEGGGVVFRNRRTFAWRI